MAEQTLTNQQATLDTINSNLLSIMSMIFGINCRLNAQENFMRSILEKMIEGGTKESIEETSESLNDNESNQENADDHWNSLNLHIPTLLEVEPEMPTEIDEKEMACDECKQVFIRGTGEFTRHLRATSCRPYACDICKKLFKKKSNMKNHRLTHSVDNAVCSDCGASFKCEQYLRNHQKRVHQSTSEPPAKRMKLESPSQDTTTIPVCDFDETYREYMAKEMRKLLSNRNE